MPDWAVTSISVLADQLTKHCGGAASGGSAINGATLSSLRKGCVWGGDKEYRAAVHKTLYCLLLDVCPVLLILISSGRGASLGKGLVNNRKLKYITAK